MRNFISLLVLNFICLCNVNAQTGEGRVQFSINDGWKFLPSGSAYAETIQFDDHNWQSVSIPHTWNAFDPFDDDKTYRRGESWYRKELVFDQQYKDKSIFLYFEGANQLARIYVNGSYAGEHKGGYTGFSIDITKYLYWDKSKKNVLAVQLSNAHDPFIAPLNVGYASYGGIYRDVWAIVTNPLHLTTIDNNAGGVYVTTPTVSNEQASLVVKSSIQNDSEKEISFQFVNTLSDATGKEVASISKTYKLGAHQQLNTSVLEEDIKNPHLWSPDSPYLYQLKTQLIVKEKIIDEVNNAVGFRWFSFVPGDGFRLNGKRLMLHGTNRHQDMKDKGDALSLEDHRRDMKLIKEMGCNFVRLAHYPQAAEVLKLADELGLLVWEEIPVVNFITRNQEFLTNSQNMIHEMITQGYNHPSVILWGSTNEVLLHGPDGERIGKQNDTAYLAVVKQFARKLDSTVRAEDPNRYSTVAMHISDDYAKYGLDNISQVSGYNIYSGWYSGKTEEFGPEMDQRKTAGRNVFVSEYGAEGEIRLNTETPTRFDYTTQYQRYYHESYLRQINQRPWLAGTAIWNQFDFSQPNIGGPVPHMNQKGLATWDRKNKDSYYLYKANWNPAPMVYIASRDWLVRAGEKNAGSTIDVYSNASEVILSVNGKMQKKQKPNDVKKFSWFVQLNDGPNEIIASAKINGKTITDKVIIDYKTYNNDLSGLKSLSVNVGSNAQYLDPAGNVWIEDRPYQKGSFGFVAGNGKVFDRKEVIMNTDDEPMYYTYQDSIQAYRFDAPDGKYRITLCFAEPNRVKAGDRVFDIVVNDQVLVKDLDLTARYGFAQAITKQVITEATESKGITIKFNAKKGNPMLNGIKIEKY